MKQKKHELRASSLDTTVASMLVGAWTLIGGPRRKLPGLLFCTFLPQSTQILSLNSGSPTEVGMEETFGYCTEMEKVQEKKEPIPVECI